MKELIDNINLLRVEKPARYTDTEWNAQNCEVDEKGIKFALAFPDSYEIAQSGLGIKILYEIINAIPNTAAHRVFAPLPDMEKVLREDRVPLFSLEGAVPLNEFDLIGFSLHYPMAYTNLLNMLDLGGIPFYSKDRKNDDPLIIAGGTAVFNLEPIADVIDFALIGDGEESVVTIIEEVRKWKNSGGSREEILDAVSRIPGVYVPSFYEVTYTDDGRIESVNPVREGQPERVKRCFTGDMDDLPAPLKPVVPYIQSVHDRVMIEISRGCTRGCRFCQAGFIYRPVREKSRSVIMDQIEKSIESTGYDEVSLLSLSCTDYSLIKELNEELSKKYSGRGVTVSLPSLRMDNFSLDMVNMLRTSRRTSLTFAPEAGTQRLRDVINKNVTEEDYVNTLSKANEMGWQKIKLYFMLGLPTETPEDVKGIADMVHQARRDTKLQFHVSTSHFVPQAWTPFQWEQMDTIENLYEKVDRLKSMLRNRRIKYNWHHPEVSFLEGVFARGDRRLMKVIEKAWQLGCRFDGWSDYFSFDLWKQAFEECGIDPDFYLRRRELDEVLPWDHLDIGVTKEYLIEEYRKSLESETIDDCRGLCHGCGICETDGVNMDYAKKEPETPGTEVKTEEKINIHNRAQKIRIRFSKRGRLKWISHLDLMRTFERAIKRAKLPVAYTEGFHPRPKLTFLLPLPLGYTSDSEWLEIILYSKMDPVKVKTLLNGSLPEGMEVLRIREIPFSEPSLTKSLLKGAYRVEISEKTAVQTDKLRARMEDFLKSDEIIILKKNKNLNVRPLISHLALQEKENSIVIELDILYNTKGSVKPGLVVEKLFEGEETPSALYHREGLYVRRGAGWAIP